MPSMLNSDTHRTSNTRRKRELRTIQAMIRMYCRHHHSGDQRLCVDCAGLAAYAERRLESCVFGDAKPTCAKCTVHCYSASKREQVKMVMRWAGPRMLLRHPVLAMFHLVDGRRFAPQLQTTTTRPGDPALPRKPVARR